MAALNPYLNFKGNTEDAFNFYKSVFGGEFAVIQRFKDTPEAGKISKEDGEKLMHISLPIGKSNVLMGTDAIGPMADHLVFGNNFNLSFNADSEEHADEVFNKLQEAGIITIPIAKCFGALILVW